jgi:hypothetical protein
VRESVCASSFCSLYRLITGNVRYMHDEKKDVFYGLFYVTTHLFFRFCEKRTIYTSVITAVKGKINTHASRIFI